MKAHSILYSAPMVRSINRDAKWQTRRQIIFLRGKGKITQFGPSDTPGYDWHFRDKGMRWHDVSTARMLELCPYGQVGDRLWGRETWSADFAGHYPFDPVWYAADDDRRHDIEIRDGVRGIFSPESKTFVPFQWHPSIHMPRQWCRIHQDLTAVRIERVQDITEADAIAEGAQPFDGGYWFDKDLSFAAKTAKGAYFKLWSKINEPGGWAANPWVWVLTCPPTKA